jgi:hypothetical protein
MPGPLAVFVQQEKGGERKTFLAAQLYGWQKSHGCNSALVDADVSFSPISLIFPTEVIKIEMRENALKASIADVEKVAHILLEEKRSVLVDFGANTSRVFYDYFVQLLNLPEALKQIGGRITVVTPVSASKKSQFYFQEYTKHYGAFATVIMAKVLPEVVNDIKLVDYPEDLTIRIEAMHYHLQEAYENASVPLSRLATDKQFGLVQRMASAAYLRRLHAEFEKISQHLLP